MISKCFGEINFEISLFVLQTDETSPATEQAKFTQALFLFAIMILANKNGGDINVCNSNIWPYKALQKSDCR